MLRSLSETLDDSLRTLSALEGFRFRKSHRDFIKRLSNQTWAIHFSYIQHENDLDIMCDVAIRFSEVEDVLNRDRFHLSDSEKKNTFTIGAELGNIRCRRPQRWTVASETDIADVLPDIADWVENVALGFLREYSDLARTLDALRDPDVLDLLVPLNRDVTLRALERVHDA